MTKDEALKLALEALDVVKLHFTQNRHINEAITAIKEALAQPEKRPTTREEKIVRPAAYETLEQRYFCPRCGKRTADIHTCTPPQENT
jgi:hypothetical protein